MATARKLNKMGGLDRRKVSEANERRQPPSRKK